MAPLPNSEIAETTPLIIAVNSQFDETNPIIEQNQRIIQIRVAKMTLVHSQHPTRSSDLSPDTQRATIVAPPHLSAKKAGGGKIEEIAETNSLYHRGRKCK